MGEKLRKDIFLYCRNIKEKLYNLFDGRKIKYGTNGMVQYFKIIPTKWVINHKLGIKEK